MATIKTEAFELAYKFITETNLNIFLTGKAGTGKTTFLKYLKENPTKNMAVAAPTGVAALNAGGVTLHSMFQLPFVPFIPNDRDDANGFNRKTLLSRMRFNSEKINFFHALELLVIDEASMVASNTVDAIDVILRSVRHKQVPFGGVQVLFIGDLHQLQPVVKKDEWQYMKQYYSSIFFFDSHVLRNNIPVMIELKKIFRQKDKDFIDILNGIRENTLTQDNLKLLNQRMKPNFISGDGDGYITLTTHNDSANRINDIKLNRLAHPLLKFKASIEGEFPEHMFPAEKELNLKQDSQVMFIKNDLEEKRFYNGKIGIVTSIADDEIIVESDGEKINVSKHDWENINYSIDPDTKEIKESLIGTFTQYPLRLAWAITIHKSQGLTFDKVVIDAENAFANGQVYVALSRATTLEGLILTSPVNDRFLGAHTDLVKWKENNHNENSLPTLFENARKAFMKQELFNAFSFDHFRHALQTLKKEVQEETENIAVKKWINDFSDKHNEIWSTANKFKETLHILWNENPDVLKNEKLNSRVIDAAVYFSAQLSELGKFIVDHQIKVSTKRVARKIDKQIEELHDILTQILTKINLCLKGFNFYELIAWKKVLPKRIENINSSYEASIRKESKSETASELYDRINSFRKEIAEQTQAPLYMIFGNSAIKGCCEILPGDKQSLLTVSGFGKKKVEEYGEEVLKIIQEYCEENKISLNYVDDKARKELNEKKSSSVTETVKQTIRLFKTGKNISEICSERNLASSTIEGHLSIGIKNKLVDIEQILPKNEIDTIASYFSDKSFDLKSAREKSESEISFGKLRMVQAWLIAEKVSL